jgi:hypothetical protein
MTVKVPPQFSLFAKNLPDLKLPGLGTAEENSGSNAIPVQAGAPSHNCATLFE